MGFLQSLLVALRALTRNTLRSILTALGIIIGVGAVITMVAIGEGAKAQVGAQFAAMGSNLLVVTAGSSNAGGSRGGAGSQPTLTMDDVAAMRDLASVRWVAPVWRTYQPVISDEQNWTTQIFGTTPDYFPLRSWAVSAGSLFGDGEIETGAKVALLGQTVVEKLFGANADAVGQIVRIKNVPFEVVGVLERKGQSMLGQDYDDAVIVPSTTYRAKIQGGLQKYVQGTVYVSADSPDGVRRAEAQIGELLRERHRLDGDDDFQVRNLAEMAQAMAQGQQTLSLLLLVVAAVSLVVGGIGIMNIMLVSVTERTREIGVRMAVGATPSQILLQFLVESSALAVIGGLIGIASGVGASLIIAQLCQWAVLIRYDIVLVAVSVAGAIGIVFGLYPAWKASRLDPIAALRFE